MKRGNVVKSDHPSKGLCHNSTDTVSAPANALSDNLLLYELCQLHALSVSLRHRHTSQYRILDVSSGPTITEQEVLRWNRNEGWVHSDESVCFYSPLPSGVLNLSLARSEGEMGVDRRAC